MPHGFSQILGQNVQHLKLIMPELAVALGFLLGLIFDIFAPESRRKVTGYICLIALIAGLFAAVNDMNGFVWAGDAALQAKVETSGKSVAPRALFSGMVVRDSFSTFFKLIILSGTAISLLIALNARELFGRNHGEFFLLLLATCLGGMFLVSADHLLMIYLALESLSIVSYAMAGFLRMNRKSSEAGIKYVIYGAMASGIMIFGMSYLYGLTGSMDMGVIAGEIKKIYQDHQTTLAGKGAVIAILAMVFSGLLYKIAAAPFHYWSPDVYEGAPTTATGFFSVVPKAAGFAILLRVLTHFCPLGMPDLSAFEDNQYGMLEMIVSAIAILTMLIGNLAALGQNNAKRMMAYSSIAHAGYMLAGLTVFTNVGGAAAVLFYLVVYLFMNLGAFLALVGLENSRGSCELKSLRGSIKEQPLLGVALVVFLFSLTGLPPFAGFMGKYLIMERLANQDRWFMVLMIGLNSVISLYYYMRLAKVVTMDPAPGEESIRETEKTPVYTFLAVAQISALLLLFIFPEPVIGLCHKVLEPLTLGLG